MVGIEEIAHSDFSGGWFPRLSATEFSERQWARLEGLVIEDPTRLRSQWSLQKIGTATGFVQLHSTDGRLVGRKADGTFWWALAPNSGLDYQATRDPLQFAWTQITGITADPELRILCRIPLRNADSEGWREGLLINGRDRAGAAYAVYFPGGGAFVKTWTAKWPGTDPSGTDDVMPPANVGGMWGDFLVLGDIRWVKDSADPLSNTNQKTYPHGLWYSVGGKADTFAPLDVEFMSFHHGPSGKEVRSLVPIDAGFLVFTRAGVALLRGDGNAHDIEPLRTGLGPSGPAVYWSDSGTVVWLDVAGQVWHTNGEEFSNLTELGLNLDRTTAADDHVAAFGEYLLVARGDRLLCFRAFTDEGAWSELIPPAGGVRSMLTLGDQCYLLDTAGAVWRFNRRQPVTTEVSERGWLDGVPAELVLASRTAERGGHEVTFWHRAGIRCQGPGRVVRVTLRAGPALDPATPSLVYSLDEPADLRHEQVVPGHGPSVEASQEWVFTGDVWVEQVAWWAHRGRGSR